METNTISSTDGIKLYSSYLPGNKDRLLLWVHGAFEYSGRYLETARFFADKGYPCALFDLRGHGDSTGTRAHVKSFDEYTRDVFAAYNYYKTRGTKDITLIGHSTGALIAIRFGQNYPNLSDVRNFILTSPFLGAHTPPPLWKTTMAHLLNAIAPSLALSNDLNPDLVSTDAAVAKAYGSDPKVIKTVTSGWYFAVLAAQEAALAGAPNFPYPAAVLLAGAEKITNNYIAEKFYKSLPPDKQTHFFTYYGMYHEILNDLNKIEVYNDILKLLE